jgi:murein DD-endopeptidase MepM/ murein hydrolase activator NlpD
MKYDRRDAFAYRRQQRSVPPGRVRLRLVAHAALLMFAILTAVVAGLVREDHLLNEQARLASGFLIDREGQLSQSLGDRLAGEASAAASATEQPARQVAGLNLGGALPNEACEPGDSPAYCIYTVREGDTLSGIAEIFGLNGGVVPGWELLAASNKPDIVDIDDFIQPGQKLRVPLERGVVHTILLAETVGDLATQFDVTSAEIVAANQLANPDLLTTGQVLFIPDPNKLPTPELPGAAPSGPGSEPEEEEEAAPPARGFIWPITATVRITNYMTARHPLGIDMGLGHAAGSPVVAAGDGVVEFAGGNACCSYGLYVIIDHGNGLKTLYAHLASLEVSKGQRVSQGQRLGPSGRTGYSTGVHLHFEVYKDGKRVNPIDYLP